MKLELVTKPSSFPVSLQLFKIHARIDDDIEDLVINSYIASATKQAENYQERKYITQSWALYLDSFYNPFYSGNYNQNYLNYYQTSFYSSKGIPLWYPPLIQVDTIEYYDKDGVLQTLNLLTDVQIDKFAFIPAIYPGIGKDWPDTQDERINAVKISFSVGYGSATDVPEEVIQAILLIAADMYERKEDKPSVMPKESEYLLSPNKVIEL